MGMLELALAEVNQKIKLVFVFVFLFCAAARSHIILRNVKLRLFSLFLCIEEYEANALRDSDFHKICPDNGTNKEGTAN